MTAVPDLCPARWSKIPAALSDAVRLRREWSFCAMEESRIDAIELREPGASFHHLALPLDRSRLSLVLDMDGHRRCGRNAPDTIATIEAGSAGYARWDAPFESACFYFTDEALGRALGAEASGGRARIRTGIDEHAPVVARLLRALHQDAEQGQPHGVLVGDAIFLALAATLAPQAASSFSTRKDHEAWRVGNAVAYIQAHLCGPIDIARVAAATATSPYYLNRMFRASIGCSIWQYVLRERARCAALLIKQQRWTLTEIGAMAGFETHASFIASMRREFGRTPTSVRRASDSDRRARSGGAEREDPRR